MNIGELIPIFWNVNRGLLYQFGVFFWLYHESKNKNATIIEISKNLDDPQK